MLWINRVTHRILYRMVWPGQRLKIQIFILLVQETLETISVKCKLVESEVGNRTKNTKSVVEQLH